MQWSTRPIAASPTPASAVEPRPGGATRPPVEPGTQDLIWCEGAIYFLGVTEALLAWRPLLRPGATVAFTEPVWLSESPPTEVRDWWLAEYPSITDDAGLRARVDAAGYQTVASFVLPASAWWDEYYGPMRGRVEEVRGRRPDDPAAAEAIREAEREIDMFRRFCDHYSYTFSVVQPVVLPPPG